MRGEYLGVSKAVRHLQRLRPTEKQFQHFKERLAHFYRDVESDRKGSTGSSEESEKGAIRDLLRDAFYSGQAIRPKKYKGPIGSDLTIRSGHDNTLVLIEAKRGSNIAEMVSQELLVTKAFVECVVYYGFEKHKLGNDHIKHVVITNARQWFIFDAADFRAATWDKAAVREAFLQWEKGNLDSTSTSHLHQRLKEILANSDHVLHGVQFDLWSYKKFLDRTDDEATRYLMNLWRLLHPGFLLKEGAGKDSNALNKNFYHELLYILGLREVKEQGRKVIQRFPEKERRPGAWIEHTITQLDRTDALEGVQDREIYGATREEQLYNVAMELCITWLNRVLFLKLLEAQLLRIHNGDRKFAFLSPDRLVEFDQFHSLFFEVMAVERERRDPQINEVYGHIPYLNSSLFEPTQLERHALHISGLKNHQTLPLYGRTVLIERKLSGVDPTMQEYLLRFLQAYDFGSEASDGPKADDRPLITASVLGLIFEKINGYKDGSFYTPGYITMYMCRETIRRAVLQRFNEARDQPFSGWEALVNYAAQQFEPEIIKANEAKIDALRICDPAVGSGHFLVSALNELIAIKSELGLFTDHEGKRITDHRIEVVNDELIVTDRRTDEVFSYTAVADGQIPSALQRVQCALFEQKRKLIENCLFGVDINPNSVKICRLRLWIELLKNAYYHEENGRRDLRTLPNIDINIKTGNSVLSRYKLTDNISTILDRTGYTVEQYQGFVSDYQEATDREARKGFKKIIEDIEQNFTKLSDSRDPNQLALRKLTDRYMDMTGTLLGGGYKDEKAKLKAEAERKKLEEKIKKLQTAIEQEKAGYNHKLAFDWRYRFPQVLKADTGEFRGFDVIIGNPPYIRQEVIRPFKHRLKDFHTFHSSADLFVYFMELGHRLLAPNGHFCYIVANKWMRAGYGAKLRRWLGENVTIVKLIDFGDLPVFEEATTYPCILLTRQGEAPREHEAKAIAMTEIHSEDLHAYVEENALRIPQRMLVRNDYRIASESSNSVLEKIRSAGVPLGQFLNGKVYWGIKTGLNQAFVIDAATRDRLIAEDPRSAEVIKPFLVGRDLGRYAKPKFKRFLILFEKGSTSKAFGQLDEISAAIEMSKAYPAIMNWLEPFAIDARKRTDKGEYWWELRACDYYDKFERDKILYPDIAPFPEFQLVRGESYCGNTCYFVPSGDKYLLAVLNSKVFAYYYASVSTIMRGGYFRFFSQYVEAAPIPEPDPAFREFLESAVDRRLAGDESVETEIDKVVYELYGLTEEEVGVVEGR